MNISIRGDADQVREIRARLGENFHYTLVSSIDIRDCDLLVDFRPDPGEPFPEGPIVLADVMKYSLAAFAERKALLVGFCGWPGFWSTPSIEVCTLGQAQETKLNALAKDLNVSVLNVPNQIGLVAPRVVAMMINEAHLALDEGIATRADIDVAMKLGTGYPFGPFEWCEKIGAHRVVDLLKALAATQPNRYKIARALLAKI